MEESFEELLNIYDEIIDKDYLKKEFFSKSQNEDWNVKRYKYFNILRCSSKYTEDEYITIVNLINNIHIHCKTYDEAIKLCKLANKISKGIRINTKNMTNRNKALKLSGYKNVLY